MKEQCPLFALGALLFGRYFVTSFSLKKIINSVFFENGIKRSEGILSEY